MNLTALPANLILYNTTIRDCSQMFYGCSAMTSGPAAHDSPSSTPASYQFSISTEGIADEARVSNTMRSAAWIKATHYSNEDELVSFGSEESIGWSGKINSITNPTKINGVTVANISKVMGQ